MNGKRKKISVVALLISMTMILAFAGCGKKSEAMDIAYESDWNASKDFGFSKDGMVMSDAIPSAVNKSSYASVSGSDYSSEKIADVSRKTIKTMSMSVQTTDFDQFIEQLEANIKLANGYSEYANTYTSASGIGYKVANYTIRIPRNNLDQFASKIGDLGTVTSKTASEDDITLQYVDTESRVKAYEIEQERLLALLEKADSISDIMEIEDRLSDVRYRLESYASRLRTYDNQVDYSTLTLEVREVMHVEITAEKTTGERIGSGFVNSLSNIGNTFKNIFVWLIISLPHIVVLGAIGVGIWRLVVVISRRSAKKRVNMKKEQNINIDEKVVR